MTTTITIAVRLTDGEAVYVRNTWAGFLPSDRYPSDSLRAKIYDALPPVTVIPEPGKFYAARRIQNSGGTLSVLRPDYLRRVEVFKIATRRQEPGLGAYLIDADGDAGFYRFDEYAFQEVQ